MFSFAVFSLVLASCCVSGIILSREAPSEGWMTDYFEPYAIYYARYVALSCDTKHGTDSDFFDQCCRPLLTAEGLSDRPPECDPDLPDCDDDDPTPTSVSIPTDTPAITTSRVIDTLEITTSEEAPAPTNTEGPALKPVLAAKKAAFSKTVNTGGYATYYFQDGVAGACGTVHNDNDYIAAIDGDRYGNLGEQSDLCGKRVRITNNQNGRTVIVMIADACPTCLNSNSIDLSTTAFQAIATLPEGMVPISWSFV